MMLLLVLQRPYITITPKEQEDAWCMWRAKALQIGHDEIWELHCEAKKSIFRISWSSTTKHQRSSNSHSLPKKSLYRPYSFRRKINERIIHFNTTATPLYEDNPTTLISKCMPQCWLISLKSLHYKSAINPSRIFTYHSHGGWSVRLRLSTSTQRETKAMLQSAQ